MPSANVYDMDGQVVREESLWMTTSSARPINTAVLHQVVTAQLVNRRQGTASTRRRALRSAAATRSPIARRALVAPARVRHARRTSRGGGVVFGPHPHPYERAIPRKVQASGDPLGALG